MPINSKPVFDCLSCDAFDPNAMDRNRGFCRRNPPTGQITGMDNLGRPQVASVVPPVGRGVWCLQHPMAKAFPAKGPQAFVVQGEGNGSGKEVGPVGEPAGFDVEETGADDGDLPGEHPLPAKSEPST